MLCFSLEGYCLDCPCSGFFLFLVMIFLVICLVFVGLVLVCFVFYQFLLNVLGGFLMGFLICCVLAGVCCCAVFGDVLVLAFWGFWIDGLGS